jgi:hypothetical protein
MSYLVEHNGKTLGPFSREELPGRVESQELALTYLARDEYHGRRFLADAHLPSYAFD